MNKDGCEGLENLLGIARIELSSEEYKIICSSVSNVAKYLREVGQALENREDVKPLYHVWEESTALREGGRPRTVDVKSFLHEEKLDREGRIRIPWKERG